MAHGDRHSEVGEVGATPADAGERGLGRQDGSGQDLAERDAGGPELAGHDVGVNGTERKSERTRRRILDAAAKVFRARGYAGARLADIAAEAGMQAGSLYYHFDSREALVEEVMRAGSQHSREIVVARLGALPAEAGPLRRLETAIQAHLLAVLSISDYASASIKLIGQVPDDIRERQLVDQRRYGALWRTLLADAAAAGAIRDDVNLAVVRMAILGALNWSVEWYHPDGAPPEDLARDISAMVLQGLVPRSR